MKKSLFVFAAVCLLLTGCSFDDVGAHHNAHIGGYIGITDITSQSIAELDGYKNVKECFYVEHEEYQYFVKKYIFSSWGADGPSGKAQFWREYNLRDDDWIDEKVPDENGHMVERPFTKDIVVEGDQMYLSGSSWQQPWKSWKWTIYRATASELILISDKDNYFFRITKGESIEAADAYNEECQSDKYRRAF